MLKLLFALAIFFAFTSQVKKKKNHLMTKVTTTLIRYVCTAESYATKAVTV